MAVNPISTADSGATVVTSAALALSQQARQGVSEQVEQIAQKSKEPDQDNQQTKAVEQGQESGKTEDQLQNNANGSASSQTAPVRGQTINIEG
ncbi:MAG: hypothetical protein ACO3MW_11245 [Rhodospirillales bacterium]